MSVAVPYDWLKQIPRALLEREDLSVLGYPPPFPWGQFKEIIAKIFDFEHFDIERSEWMLRPAGQLFSGLGTNPEIFHLEIAPLEGTACVAIARRDFDSLIATLLLKSGDANLTIEPEYREGFSQFLALQLFNIFNKLEYDNGLSPQLLEGNDFPQEPALSQDITLSVAGHPCVGRLLISEPLRNAWKERFAQRELSVAMSEPLAEKLQLVVSLEVGHTTLSPKEWHNSAVGDFLLLESSTLDLSGEKGRAMMTLYGKPIFRTKIKNGTVKILESPLYHEVNTPMASQDDTSSEGYNDDEEFDTEGFLTEEESLEEDPTDQGEEIPEEGADIEEAEEQPDAEEGDETEETEATEPLETVATGKPMGIEETPMTVVVEVGRIQISVKKLLELQPGNLLDLDIHPENGVDLVVNGSVIAKGELLKIGDTLGVRLLDKG